VSRPPLSWPLAAVAVAAVAMIALPGPAQAATTGDARPQGAGRTTATPGLASVAPVAASGPATPALARSAADTCVLYAARAGWANNGYYSGDLVTAAAICVAESTGNPLLYVCDDNGTVVGQGNYVSGEPVDCPAGTTSYDRGLWQLNSVNASGVSDSCAFSAVCNAGQAYLLSQRGTDFEPWSSYDQDTYAQFIDPAQAAVDALTSGTVTGAELGECLVQAKSAVNAKVEIANCGSGAATQQWSVSGGKLRSGSVCAAVPSPAGDPGIVLQRCGRATSQDWAPLGRGELRDAADGKCLTDPSGSLNAGTQVDVTRCSGAKDQTWWLP